MENKLAIDFYIPHLKNDFITYFEENKPLYLEEQLQRTQQLYLLLDASEQLAEKAIDLAVKVAVDYPNCYAEDYLIELVNKIGNEEDKRRKKILIVRLSNLIYRLQLESDYSRSENIAQSFLKRLIDRKDRKIFFQIF